MWLAILKKKDIKQTVSLSSMQIMIIQNPRSFRAAKEGELPHQLTDPQSWQNQQFCIMHKDSAISVCQQDVLSFQNNRRISTHKPSGNSIHFWGAANSGQNSKSNRWQDCSLLLYDTTLTTKQTPLNKKHVVLSQITLISINITPKTSNLAKRACNKQSVATTKVM